MRFASVLFFARAIVLLDGGNALLDRSEVVPPRVPGRTLHDCAEIRSNGRRSLRIHKPVDADHADEERGFNFFRDEATNAEKDMIAQWLRAPAAVYDGILEQNGDLTVFAMWEDIGYKEDKISGAMKSLV
ncbi:hypothetical protein PI124_g2399 [Phytophthora idaei]|nr:hypothetical protein PI125_g21171 [Phytophthora idaei]KAG3128628.1 hypothetical protein PI126_g21322 [Phytophthora idaei]KAG3253043.1 hypothetical protein PI124_g2399 [Phytophthora idaei]